MTDEVGRLLPGPWADRESDEIRWLTELLKAVEENPPRMLVIERTVTVHLDVLLPSTVTDT